MHFAQPHLGPVQSHARHCRTRPDPYPLRIHEHQAHLRHGSESLHPHRDCPDCPNRRPEKDTPFPPNNRPSRKQLARYSDEKLAHHHNT